MGSRCAGLFAAITCVLTLSTSADAQVRVSPGPLARAHAALEGVAQCGRCHDAVTGISAERCLGCHKPIAARIQARKGVHRDGATECTKCHREHGGIDADLRRFDTSAFNHAVDAGFVLDGQHARVAATCKACHKKRSFLSARPACGTCHADPHKGSLGSGCTECHSVGVVFKDTRRQFDHARAKFALTGAHRTVPCEKCHAGGVFRGVRFDSCDACHKAPHRNTLGPSCASCHVTDRWATRTVEHAKTGFVLTGAHAQLACVKCHASGVRTRLPFERCSACHANVHRDSLKEDCRKCHNETSFKGAAARFEHASRTSFPLAGKHDGLACRKCHTAVSGEDVPVARKVIDFRGASRACVTCHKDEHKGEYGRLCDSCHTVATFKAKAFVHPGRPEFFAGRHQGIACVKCHVRPADLQPLPQGAAAVAPPPLKAPTPSTSCSACHADVHLGQVGSACDRCHAVDGARFAPSRFSHGAGAFALTGKHQSVACVKCHPSETRPYPAGNGTAKRLKPVSSACQDCHKDPHLGQVDPRCDTCHSTAAFTVAAYAHPGLEYTFGIGNHDALPCKRCHKTETRQFPSGWGTAVRLTVGRTCKDCHG